MTDIEINQRILDEVEQIDDEDRREFIIEILAFERKKMDRDQPHFRDDFHRLIEKHGPVLETEEDEEAG